MGVSIRQPLVLMLGGTSLTAGRLCTPPYAWNDFLRRDMMANAACKGPVIIINTGQGSQTSNFGATQAAKFAALRPSHVLMEDFGINDCAIGPVSIPQATLNFNAMVASYRAANPDVIIAHQTMSPASATDVNRVNLATYYTNGLANAVLNDIESLDNYADWPKPLDPLDTVGAAPFAIALTAGYSGQTVASTWNPLDKSANITLSTDNNSATTTSGAVGGIRGNEAITGLTHFEITVGPGAPSFGIANLAAALTPYFGSDNNGISLQSDGTVLRGGGSVGNAGFAFANGDVVGFEVDTVADFIYFMKGAARSAGFNIAAIAGAIYPAMSINVQALGGTAKFFQDGDGLHPLWDDAFELYSYPNILAWAVRMMADYWPD